jgi:hypothetical protein
LKEDEIISRDIVVDKLKEKFRSINWQDAKNDVMPFILDSSVLDIWSPMFFSDLADHLVIE